MIRTLTEMNIFVTDKLTPRSLHEQRKKERVLAEQRWRRVRRQIASECCDRPCTVANIIKYCPDDAKLLRERPDIFDWTLPSLSLPPSLNQEIRDSALKIQGLCEVASFWNNRQISLDSRIKTHYVNKSSNEAPTLWQVRDDLKCVYLYWNLTGWLQDSLQTENGTTIF